MINFETRNKIAQQSLEEIEFARQARKSKMTGWHKNEDIYYSKKVQTDGERANVNLNEAQGFVNSFLAKINSPFNFKYLKGDEADLQTARIVNAIKEQDANKGKWNFKAMVARLQLIIYGRYIFEYHAESEKGYKSHLTPVDVYHFLIDPSCGGLDIENAFYLGRGGIIKSLEDLKAGVKKGKYLRTETNELTSGTGNVATESQEDIDAKNRWVALTSNQKVITRTDQWKFWEWYTTYEGDRYYVLVTEDGGKAIRVEPLEDVFANNKYPFFTAAAYPDLAEFWTPSPLDGVREVIMAKATSINQLLDNGEAINRPMKAFDTDAIKNPALLKYRKDGLIPVKPGVDINKAIQFFPTAPLQAAINVYDKMSQITDINSGVNAGTKGMSNETTVGVYEGNQANSQDRFSLIGDSEADAQERFANLYLDGLDEHLNTEIAVEMIGIEGVKFQKVTKKDIKRNQPFHVMVITAGTEASVQNTEKRNKLTFLASKAADMTGVYNRKILAEMEASIAGFTIDEIKAMTDNKAEGNAEIMAECARDIQRILEGETVEPNEMANTAYLQKIRDYIRDEQEYMKKHPDTLNRMWAYFDALNPIVLRNMTQDINQQLIKEGIPSMPGQQAGIIPEVMPGEMPQAPGATPAPQAQQPISLPQTIQNYGK